MLNVLSSPANGAAIPDVPCAERRIACRAGIRTQRNSPQNELWVESPRTGKRLTIGDGWWPELLAKAPTIKAKIVAARAVGRAVVELTVAELKAFAATYDYIQNKCRPQQRSAGVYSNYRIKPGRRRGWINR